MAQRETFSEVLEMQSFPKLRILKVELIINLVNMQIE